MGSVVIHALNGIAKLKLLLLQVHNDSLDAFANPNTKIQFSLVLFIPPSTI